MVWQEGAQLVVMLSQVVEEGRVKCDQYWPKSEAETIEVDGIRVMNRGVLASLPGLVVTTLELQDISVMRASESLK